MSLTAASQVRVRFVTEHAEYAVSDAPFSLPAKLGRQGLSEVVNHLLGLGEEQQQSFDFLVDGRLLRSPLYKFMTSHRISAEDIVVVDYFPSLSLSEETNSVEMPAWVGSLDTRSSEEVCFAGCYDGSVKVVGADLQVVASAAAHTDPVRAVHSWACDGDVCVATASKDHSVKVWSYDGAGRRLLLQSTLRGHVNSVESLARWSPAASKDALLLSGDWSGNLFAWKVGDNQQSSDAPAAKRKKDREGQAEAVSAETKPLFTIKAHQQSISSICTQEQSVHAFTSSWDHGVKCWDLDRQDCVQTFNCAKVATALDARTTSAGTVLASAHSDGKVRVWDFRAKNTQGDAALSFGKTTNWISQVNSFACAFFSFFCIDFLFYSWN